MAGNKKGGLQAAAKNKASDPDFYRKIGSKGGRLSRGGGFTGNPELASMLGKLGGAISTRSKKPRSAEERAKIRQAYEKNYKHLLQVHKKASAKKHSMVS